MTTSPVIDPDLLERARPLVAEGISKNKLREELGVRRETAALVHDTLSAELAPPVPDSYETPAAQVMPTAPTLVPQPPSGQPARRVNLWPYLIYAAAFVAIWSGWVELGRLTGFGVVHPFPGIPHLENFAINTAITLPVSLEAYGAYALRVGTDRDTPSPVSRYATRTGLGSLFAGIGAQAVLHLMVQRGVAVAPWPITVAVSAVPVVVVAMFTTLRRKLNNPEEK